MSEPAPGHAFSYDQLFQLNPTAQWLCEVESGRMVAANEAALRLYGYTRADFVFLRASQLFAGREEVTARQLLAAAEAPATHIPTVHRAKDGRLLQVDLQVSELQGTKGPLMLASVRDLGPRTWAEERLREQASLLDLASDAIMVCNLTGTITFWNQGAAQLYGWPVPEAMGAALSSVVGSRDDMLIEARQAALEDGHWSGELEHYNRAGHRRIVNSRWTAVHDDDGIPKSLLIINSDLTEAKNMEAQFLRAQRVESLGTLASGIAHDLNNILSPIMMSATVLRNFAREPEAARILGIIESSAERGAGIVKQVLTFARGVEGERIALQPRHLVNEMGRILAQTFPRNIHVRLQLPNDLWTVLGDATQLHQVLLNLCVNARDAMPEGGTLTLAAENVSIDAHFALMNTGAKLGDYLVLRVTDTGTGMDAETQDRIFEPFFTTKAEGKGTGLGLATVMGIVKGHGGFLTVQSEPGVGTSFRVFLPAVEAAEDSNLVREEPEDFRGKGELVLVVDDEATIREALVQTLESHGYRAYTAEDGSDGLALFFQRKGEFKLVLTDVSMGQMDGVTMSRAIRKMAPEVPIVISSGHVTPEQTVLLEQVGVRHFLDKPYTAAKLMRTLHLALQPKAPAAK